MTYQGINGNGQVVIPIVSEEEKNGFRANPAYNFVRFIPIVAKEEAPAEVEDAKPNQQLNGNSKSRARSGRKTDRENS